MRTHRKPDLLFMLAVIAGIGVIISSYIQYERANANAADEGSLVVNQQVIEKPNAEESFVLVSTQAQTIAPNDDPVNNSLPRP